MKKIILIFAVLLTTVTFAQNKNAKASIEVDGVCGMCNYEKTVLYSPYSYFTFYYK